MVNFTCKLGETNVKVKWLACHERGTKKKNLSPWQDSNLWPPKHRAGALSTWATENSFLAQTKEQGIEHVESQMASTEVAQKSEVKLLGVTLDKQLRFMTHVSNVCRKVSSLVGVISRWRKLIPSSGKLQIFKSAMLPHLTYYQMIWPFCCASEAWELEKL